MASGYRCLSALALVLCFGLPLEAATISVPAGGNLQQALNAALPGDVIVLAEGAEYVGNFVLPVKSGEGWITVRSAAPDSLLPGPGVRIRPSHAPLLARLRSPNALAALRTAAGAHHWRIQYLEFAANQNGYGDILQIGDGSSAQNSLGSVPHHLELDHLYVHGDPRFGQKRCIALNAADVTIRDSHVVECKGVGQDTQAICGWNGPGPYTIENNYLEAAGEVVMFGGADPAIANLVPGDIVFRGNYLTRPMAWRSPIIGTPAGVTATATGGGSLVPGTYAYRVVARGSVGQGTTGRSTASVEASASVSDASGGAVHIQWQPVAGASEYRVYGRAPGAENVYWTVTTTAFLDTGASGTTEAVPTSAGTVWTVKNLFELKNARNVLVEDNILENHWKEAQPGYSIVLTPRNSNGACTWCVVEQVTLQYNVVRNVAAGINLLGYDIASRPTRQSNHIVIRQNLFRATTALGGNGWFIQIGDEPRDVTIEHNTIDSNGTTVVYTYGGTSTDPREIYGFRMSANAARHGTYGFGGAYFQYGTGILTGFYPGHEFTANYLAGGSASRYPSGTLVSGVFTDQFVDPAGGDFTVRSASALRGAAPDGSDIGVDVEELGRRTTGVDGGSLPIGPTAGFTSSCTALTCTFSSTSTAGDEPIVSQSWTFGDGGQASGTEVTHTFAAGGPYTVSLVVGDGSGLSSNDSETVTVVAPNTAPVADFTFSCTNLACTFSDASEDAGGSIASVAWTFGDGGTATGAQASHSFAAAGTYQVTVTVVDNGGASASVTRGVTVSAANVAPAADFTSSCTNLACTFSDASEDADGSIASAAWTFGDGGTATGAQASHSFAAAGTYQVTVTVVDNGGASASATRSITVSTANVAPVADFTSSCADLACTFTDTSQDSDGSIASVAWNFGDGGTATGTPASHTFAAAGTYQVTLTVVDNRGASASVTRAVTVQQAAPPRLLHGAFVSATVSSSTKSRNVASHSWSVEVVLAVHETDERVAGGATITAAWGGAIARTVSCTTNTAGRCTVRSNALAMDQPSVSLTLTGITAPAATYGSALNHSAIGGASVTSTVLFNRP